LLFLMLNLGSSLGSQSFQQTLTLNDVFRIQFTLRYTFN